MKYIPITKLSLSYKAELSKINAEQFRGAFLDYLLKKMPELPIEFAANKDKEGKKNTGYSLVQFRTFINKLEIVSLANAAELTDKWMDRVLEKNDFTINGKPAGLENPQKQTYFWYPKLGKHQLYKIQTWVPFGKDNIGDESLFDKIIWGNIQRMLSDLNIVFHEKIHIHIHEYQRNKKTTKGYDVNWITYTIVFSTNINLPQHIGLGRIISLGAGKIQKISVLRGWGI